MRHFLPVVALLGIVLAASVAYAAEDSYSGTVIFDCDGFDTTNNFITLNRDNTGYSEENWYIKVTDGLGNEIFYQYNGYSYPMGTVPLSDYLSIPQSYDTAPLANPITFTAVSEAGNGYLTEQTITVQQGNCNLLPLPASALASSGDTCPVLPEGAVVGDLPFGAQAYYAPGKAADGVVLNAGTYWVLGEDESGEYYKIQLACEFLWLPVNVLQPSFQPPWSGQPLPTEVVS